MKKPTYKGKELLPLSVIDAARDGDSQAVDQVLRYYEGYINTKKETPERRTYTVDDIAQILGIGRTSAYILVKEGHFKIVRIGNAIRISKRSFDEWLDSLDL